MGNRKISLKEFILRRGDIRSVTIIQNVTSDSSRPDDIVEWDVESVTRTDPRISLSRHTRSDEHKEIYINFDFKHHSAPGFWAVYDA